MAHASHWLPQLVFAAPVLVIFFVLAWNKLHGRRRGRVEEEGAYSEPSLDDIMDGRA